VQLELEIVGLGRVSRSHGDEGSQKPGQKTGRGSWGKKEAKKISGAKITRSKGGICWEEKNPRLCVAAPGERPRGRGHGKKNKETISKGQPFEMLVAEKTSAV